MTAATWQAALAQQADALDRGTADSHALLPSLAAAGLTAAGVPQAQGGSGGDVRDAVAAIAEVAQHSLTAAFVLWGHRTFIEYLLQSPQPALAERWLPDLLAGRLAGATGLSNAMKYLAGIESLQVQARVDGDTWTLNGQLPWVTNLRPAGFLAAAAVARDDGGPAAIAVLDSRDPGVQRSADLELLALRGSHTAALRVSEVRVAADTLITDAAPDWLPRVRPAFLGMQCGMSIGLARASLKAAAARSGESRPILGQPLAEVAAALDEASETLLTGLADRRYEQRAAPLFRLRIRLAGLVQQAALLELQASGGAAYLVDRDRSFGRRWAEAAFIPVITPSLTQLQAQLQKLAA